MKTPAEMLNDMAIDIYEKVDEKVLLVKIFNYYVNKLENEISREKSPEIITDQK